jgi:nucleoside-diphosphate-sugar epimerase
MTTGGKKILVTGASGSIGTRLVAELQRRGHRVTPAGRTGTDDVLQVDPLGGLVDARLASSKFDAVVHLGDGLKSLEGLSAAAAAPLMPKLLAGNRAFAAAVRTAGIPLFVHVSSIKALADEARADVMDEDSAPQSTAPYGTAKLALEGEMRRAFDGAAATLVMLRNPLTYGPGAPGAGRTGSLERLAKVADSGLPFPSASRPARRSLLAVANFVDAIAHVVEAPKPVAGTFHVHDGEPPSVGEIVAWLREGLGRPPRLLPLPGALWTMARQIPQLRPTVDRLAGALVLDDRKFRAAYGWRPVVTTRAELIATAKSWSARAAAH